MNGFVNNDLTGKGAKPGRWERSAWQWGFHPRVSVLAGGAPLPLSKRRRAFKSGRGLPRAKTSRKLAVSIHKARGAHRMGPILWVLIFFLLNLGSISAQETGSARRSDYSRFEIVSERNIFNAHRSPRRAYTPRVEAPQTPARTESIALVGTMVYEKGPHAFFDGSSSDYRKVVALQETIAGFTVASIGLNQVSLQNGDKKLELRVGKQIRREDEGEWRLSDRHESFSRSQRSDSSSSESGSSTEAGNSASNATPASESSGEMSDVLKRLLQKREQEIK